MKIKDLIKIIEEKYPLSLKESWDNVGLMIGDAEHDVEKVLVTLDTTMETIKEAKELGANLIISHHPFIFEGMKSITTSDSKGKKIFELIKNNIAVYSMHTNLDIAEDGLNDYFARKLDVVNSKRVPEDFNNPYMRYGALKNEMTLKELTGYVKEKLKLDNVALVSRDDNKIITHVAFVTGSGKSFINDAKKLLALEPNTCYITGDMNYHAALDAIEDNVDIIDAGHFGTECITSELLYEIINNKDISLEVIRSKTMINPLKIY